MCSENVEIVVMGPSRLEGAELLEICSELSDNPVIHSRNENDA